MDRGGWQATVHGVARVGHNLTTKPPLCLLETLTKNKLISLQIFITLVEKMDIN